MRFSSDRPIFLQIADLLEDEILAGRIGPGERLPSARDLAAGMEVNPNTAARVLQTLSERQVAGAERGSGYFVLTHAPEMIMRTRRERFMSQTLPELFGAMRSLGIGMEELQASYLDFTKGAGHEGEQ